MPSSRHSDFTEIWQEPWKKGPLQKKQAYNAVIEFKIVLQKFPHSTCLSLYSISEYNLFENVLFNIFM